MRITGQTFINQEILLDFIQYDHCVFEKCVMVFSGYGPLSIIDCEFRAVRWVFSDAAATTVQFMKTLFNSGEGGRMVVESMLQVIKGGGPQPELTIVNSPRDNLALAPS